MTLIIDVRERDEFKQEHIPHSINLPLSEMHQIESYKPLLSGKEPLLICRSGKRALLAKDSLDRHQLQCEVFPGGIEAWKKSGKHVVKGSKTTVSLFRQVQITVGALVLVFSLLTLFKSPWFAVATAVLGGGLFVAGLFGFCMLAILLAKMPWNRVQP